MLFHYFREGFLASSDSASVSLCPELGNQFLEVKIFFELLFPVSGTINTFSLDLPRVSSIYSDYTVKSQYMYNCNDFFPPFLLSLRRYRFVGLSSGPYFFACVCFV